MILDTRWAEMVDKDQPLLVELMAQRIESDLPNHEGDREFVAGMRYALELLSNRETLIMDSYSLFEREHLEGNKL